METGSAQASPKPRSRSKTERRVAPTRRPLSSGTLVEERSKGNGLPSNHGARSPESNQLIAALPRGELRSLADAGVMISFAHHEVVAGSGEPLRHVWFPTAGMISLVSGMRDGSSVEMVMIGPEGLIGVPWLTRPEPQAGFTAVAQVPGTAFRVPVALFLELIRAGESLPRLVDRFGEFLFHTVGRNAACNCMHGTKGRLARWLLVTEDRTGRDQVFVTHEFLSQMLGVRRVGVTHAVGALQADGGIECQRGRIVIVDRSTLIESVCECYEENTARLAHLYE